MLMQRVAGTHPLDLERQFLVQSLLARYAEAIDDDRFEDWLDLFTENCKYRLMTAQGLAAGPPASLLEVTSRAMLDEHVRSLREAHADPVQRFRHFIGTLRLEEEGHGEVRARANFLVARTALRGETSVFATGYYDDHIVLTGDMPRFVIKTVVLDAKIVLPLSVPI